MKRIGMLAAVALLVGTLGGCWWGPPGGPGGPGGGPHGPGGGGPGGGPGGPGPQGAVTVPHATNVG